MSCIKIYIEFFNRHLFAGLRPSLEDVIVSEKCQNIKTLMELCWNIDPDQRPTMKRLAFIFGIDPESYDSNILNVRALPPISNDDFYYAEISDKK